MLRLDLICLTNSGISAVRMTRVRPMIDSTQAIPVSGSEDVTEQVVEAGQHAEMA